VPRRTGARVNARVRRKWPEPHAIPTDAHWWHDPRNAGILETGEQIRDALSSVDDPHA